MKNQWKPKDGDTYFYWYQPKVWLFVKLFKPGVASRVWKADIHDVYNYWENNVHPTREAAESWGAAQGEKE
jgi:hypothetical protein